MDNQVKSASPQQPLKADAASVNDTAAPSASPQIKRCQVFVSGKVQGVFYRKHTKQAAAGLGLTGWVRNLSDGRVEVLAEGTADQLQALEAWCHRGSPKSKVTAVEVRAVAGEKRTFRSFEVQR